MQKKKPSAVKKNGPCDKFNYHMARTAPRSRSMQNYWENARMRAVRISASRAGKSRTALLGTHTAHRDAFLEDFVAF